MADWHTFARKAQARKTLTRETMLRKTLTWETLSWEAMEGRTLVREAWRQGGGAADRMSRAAGTRGGAAAHGGNAFVDLALKVTILFAHFRSIPFWGFVFIVRHYVTSSHFPVYGL